ncbi:MAG TPA: RuBisCO large subunit C-terminal-like domain-containing protein [Gemmatimonadales bacterium]|nr:RuBisCO large subunit C-terminal-like domain-containing protein [Gemmatimonadales bacterium]
MLRATYLVQADAGAIEARAEALLLEQTVELPRAALRDRTARERVLGRIELIELHDSEHYKVVVAQPLATTALDPAQLLNVVFGNASLWPDVVLDDVNLPDHALAAFPGPNLGVEGWRALTGVADRPLTATALKPMGLDAVQLARLAGALARAGLDVVKDDHGLADHPFCPFEQRVEACQRAVGEAAGESGRAAVYVPNLIGTPDRVFTQLRFAREAGVRAVMISPMVVGLPLLHQLAAESEDVAIMAHPAFGGSLRISETALLGKLFRWYGADAVIFPHAGGRFSYSLDTCRALADEMRRPQSAHRSALPVPAGGIRVERVAQLVRFYGRDCMLLIGASLYEAGDQIGARAGALVDAVARAASEAAEET